MALNGSEKKWVNLFWLFTLLLGKTYKKFLVISDYTHPFCMDGPTDNVVPVEKDSHGAFAHKRLDNYYSCVPHCDRSGNTLFSVPIYLTEKRCLVHVLFKQE